MFVTVRCFARAALYHPGAGLSPDLRRTVPAFGDPSAPLELEVLVEALPENLTATVYLLRLEIAFVTTDRQESSCRSTTETRPSPRVQRTDGAVALAGLPEYEGLVRYGLGRLLPGTAAPDPGGGPRQQDAPGGHLGRPAPSPALSGALHDPGLSAGPVAEPVGGSGICGTGPLLPHAARRGAVRRSV